jgi:ABC-type polysaccharide/polyol phosphate export permease
MAAIPLLFLSGGMWPRAGYSQLVQHITAYAIPFVPMFDMLRGIALDGAGIAHYGHQLLVGSAWIAALALIAGRVYRLKED